MKGILQIHTRTFAIGDIHGHSATLRGLIDLIQPTSSDLLVFLGDYIDHGPDSKGVLDYLIHPIVAELQLAFREP